MFILSESFLSGDEDYKTFILETLESVDAPGTFACGDKSPSVVMPGLVIDEIGSIAFPLIEYQAKQIISKAVKAPFGRGEETVRDDAIRNTWQLDPSQFELQNPEWTAHLQEILKKVTLELGCGERNVQALLYKLLLYETGGHFNKHRDTEKTNGMFATLVITLPSLYTGGKLTVQFRGKTKTFDFASENSFRSNFVAFYADCEHEIEKVTSGYRLALVYNLVYTGHGIVPAPPDYDQLVDQMAGAGMIAVVMLMMTTVMMLMK